MILNADLYDVTKSDRVSTAASRSHLMNK